MEVNRKHIKRVIIFALIFVCFVVFIIIQCIRNYGVKTDFDSIEEFEKYGGVVLVDIPDGASDINYYCNKIFVFGLESAYSFVINNEAEYEAFMNTNDYKIRIGDTVERYMENPPRYNEAFHIRDWHSYVAEEEIKDYNVLDYYSFDGSYHAIIVNEESKKFVVIKFATL